MEGVRPEGSPERSTGQAARIVLSAAALLSGLGPLLADARPRHTFNRFWPPHAQLHEAIAILSQVAFGGLALWLLWRRPGHPAERDLSVKVATLIPVATWGPTFVAVQLPGTSLDNPPIEVLPRVFRIPVNYYLMGLPVLLAGTGYWLDRRSSRGHG